MEHFEMKSIFDVSGKKAVVTGGTKGLGRAMASCLLDNGCDVMVVSRRAEDLEELMERAAAAGAKCYHYACDITDTAKLDELIGDIMREELCEQVELLDGASFDFDLEAVRHGKLSPVFFGSALNNFGIEPFLEHFLEMTTSPLPRVAEGKVIDNAMNIASLKKILG